MQPPRMCRCSGNANHYQLVGNNINFSTSPCPSPCTCSLGTGHCPGAGLHLWVEKKDQFCRVYDINQGRLYFTVQRNVAASLFSPECRVLWWLRHGEKEAGRSQCREQHPLELLPARSLARRRAVGDWATPARHSRSGQTVDCDTPHTMCQDNDKQDSQKHFAALQFLL